MQQVCVTTSIPPKVVPSRLGRKVKLSKALHGGSEWSDKDELLDVVYWGKQILSLIIGITFGAASMHGVLAILAYVVISTMVAQHFVVKYQQVNQSN
ncbi:hypothetical protein Y032_0541g3173 [Ancylostoma ceylanicum]|nr:hypothetical protein Y032_0541g3173 [Ancylostoma ceylanicum]